MGPLTLGSVNRRSPNLGLVSPGPQRRGTRASTLAVGARVPSVLVPLASMLLASVLLAGCGSSGTAAGPAAPSSSAAPATTGTATGEVPPARVGSPAPSQRIRFVPTSIELPGAKRAPVDPASTQSDGILAVPENVSRVGWWDGGSEAGDPFGALVIAGHVDSKTEGLGFFARLRQMRVGETVTVANGTYRASYRIINVRAVQKNALATGTFDQTGPHRLVLITCTGTYIHSRGGYQQNLVVTAIPTTPVTRA